MHSLFVSTFNFSIFLIFLIFKLRVPVRSWVSTRHEYIRDELQSVQSQLREAQKHYEEVVSRLKGVESELSLMRDQNKEEMISLKQALTADSQRLSSLVISDAKNSVDRLFFLLKSDLCKDYGIEVLDRVRVIFEEKNTVHRTTDRFLDQIQEIAL